MDAEALGYLALLALTIGFLGPWMYQNVWLAPKVTYAHVLEKTWEDTAARLPDVLPGTGGVFRAASTTNILVLEINGEVKRFTANDESWKRAQVGDKLKVWVQNGSHVVGVYVVRARSE